MKATLLDFVLSALLLGTILAATAAALWLGVAPLSRAWCGDYHVLVDALAGLILYGMLSGLAIHLLLAIHPLRPGDYGMDSHEFTYWKQLTILYLLGLWALKPVTTTFTTPLIVRLFGARVGADVAIGGMVGDPFLVEIGPGAVLGAGSLVVASVIADGRISIAPVRIGAGATVGMNAVVLAGTELGDGAKLAVGAVTMTGCIIPPGETWRGNPARKWSPAAAKVAVGATEQAA